MKSLAGPLYSFAVELSIKLRNWTMSCIRSRGSISEKKGVKSRQFLLTFVLASVKFPSA
jgi:hypothetical protein